ncbi:MAG: hypothetical protein DRJ65_15160 [Acidobacteria bacterium]|nr:MAG: hypothetical protein DRJ65_15160 [Acidobacteriota bacterium]
MNRSILVLILAAFVLVIGTGIANAQLAANWIIPAVANTPGNGGTYWSTDVSIHNPQSWELPLIVQFLETGQVNDFVPTLDLVIYPYETINLWDVLGPDLFDVGGTGALLIYVPPEEPCPDLECLFLATSRTYTSDPSGGFGEFGQALPGAALLEGTDWLTYGYAAGILNDGLDFRCNIGVASWTPDWTQVAVDVQDETGAIVDTEIFDLPPFGHLQKRLRTEVMGGSLVFYLIDGPNDAFVYPYASVVNQTTGDPSYFFARFSGAGVSAKRNSKTIPSLPKRGRAVDWSRTALSR